MRDIDILISNLDEKAQQTIAEIALSMARSKQDRWTGATVWSIHYTQGAVGDAVEETKRSIFRKRAVRSRGL